MSQFTSESQFQAYTASLLRKEHMIRFLREMNIWQTIESIGQQFHDNIKRNGDSYQLAPLTITLNFDILQVQNVSVPFYDLIANETYAFVQLLNDAIFLTLSSTFLQLQPSVTLHAQQLHVLTRCSDLPDQPEYMFRQAPQVYRKGLANFQGVLTAHTDTKKFIRQSVWYCLQKCKVNTITSGELVGVQKCDLCAGDMAEYPRYRYMCDYLVVTLMPIEAFSKPKLSGEIFRGIRIKLSDELSCVPLKIGHEYHVIGVYDGHLKMFIAWNISILVQEPNKTLSDWIRPCPGWLNSFPEYSIIQ